MTPEPDQPESAPLAIPGLIVLFLLLSVRTWVRTCSSVIDFGHQLYLPWRILEGQVLYRDIEYFMGPLSQHLNAAFLSAAGVRLANLVLLNLAIIALIGACVLLLFRRMCGPRAAAVACAVFLFLFAFAPETDLNFVTPYLHEATHGVALTVLMMLALVRLRKSFSAGALGSAALLAGLTFLTKAEGFVSAAGVFGAGVTLALVYHRPGRAALLRAAAIALPACALPALVAFVAFTVGAAGMSTGDALRAVVGNWVYIFDDSLIQNDDFYSRTLGVDRPAENVARMALSALGFAAFFAAVAAIDVATSRISPRARIVTTGLCAAAAAAIILLLGARAFGAIPAAWPVIAASGAAGAVMIGLRGAIARDLPDRVFIAALWGVYSALSLIKSVLNTTILRDGFVLAMPATLFVVALALHFVPRAARSFRPGAGSAARAIGAAAVLAFVLRFVPVHARHFGERTFPVGAGADRYMETEFFGTVFGQGMDRIRELSAGRPDATLLALPEGAMLNYQLRMTNPTRYFLLTPWEVKAFGGERVILDAVRASPPDFIALFQIGFAGFGKSHYGADDEYGGLVLAWVRERYVLVHEGGCVDEEGNCWMRVLMREDLLAR